MRSVELSRHWVMKNQSLFKLLFTKYYLCDYFILELNSMILYGSFPTWDILWFYYFVLMPSNLVSAAAVFVNMAFIMAVEHFHSVRGECFILVVFCFLWGFLVGFKFFFVWRVKQLKIWGMLPSLSNKCQ